MQVLYAFFELLNELPPSPPSSSLALSATGTSGSKKSLARSFMSSSGGAALPLSKSYRPRKPKHRR